MAEADISGIISDLMAALSNCALYSEDHPAVAQYSGRAVEKMAPSLKEPRGLSFTVLGDSLFVCDEKFPDKAAHVMAFMKRLKRKGLEKAIFTMGLEPGEVVRFVSDLAAPGVQPKSTKHVSVGIVEVKLAEGGGGKAVSSIIDKDIEKLKEVHEEFSRFGRLNMVGLEDIVASFISTLRDEANVLKVISPLKDYSEYTFTHTSNVCILSIFQAESIGVTGQVLHEVGLAALLHDIGKMFVPKEILDKPGKLDDREWVYMKNHTFYGAQYLAGLDDMPRLAVMAAYEHHLKFDGTGYPEPKRRDKHQHIISQVVAVSDFFDALRTDRPYRKSMEVPVIVGFMNEASGKDFNPLLVENFIRTLKAVKAF